MISLQDRDSQAKEAAAICDRLTGRVVSICTIVTELQADGTIDTHVLVNGDMNAANSSLIALGETAAAIERQMHPAHTVN
jgi:hypothetical protein